MIEYQDNILYIYTYYIPMYLHISTLNREHCSTFQLPMTATAAIVKVPNYSTMMIAHPY